MSEESTVFSEDTILGGRVRLRQSCRGGRVSMDTVLLAAAVPARAGERVIEAGCGAGGAALAIAVRCPETLVTGVEREAALVGLMAENAEINMVADRVKAHRGDIASKSLALGRGCFHHALANPPYHRADRTVPSPSKEKARAYVGGPARLADWVGFCLHMVRDRGSVTFIHRADRLDTLLACLKPAAGDIAICPLWPRAGLPAKRVIVQARKGMKGGAMVFPGLTLHDASGGFTTEVEAILRLGAPLDLSRAAYCRLAKSRGNDSLAAAHSGT